MNPWIERREIGPCTLYLGDCLEILAAGLIPADSAIVADPPYGIGFQHSGGGAHSGWTKTDKRVGWVEERNPARQRVGWVEERNPARQVSIVKK